MGERTNKRLAMWTIESSDPKEIVFELWAEGATDGRYVLSGGTGYAVERTEGGD